MSVIAWLLTGHFVGDMLLQSAYEGLNKSKLWIPNITHAAKWTLAVAAACYFAGASFSPLFSLLLLSMGVLHSLIDRSKIPVWFLRAREYIPLGNLEFVKASEYPFWLIVWVDQVLHWLQLVILTLAIEAGL